MPLGPWELVVILLIVLVIFGAGRLSDLGGAAGKGVREFRKANANDVPRQAAVAAPAAPAAVAVAPPAAEVVEVGTTCPSCATVNPRTQVFCGQCGTRLSQTAPDPAP